MKGSDDYLSVLPKPVLDALVEGKWLPIVGSGFSRNALTPPGKKMPLWDDLGRALAEDLSGYVYSGSIDSISAYAHEYGRTELIERVSKLLLVNEASPGDAHQAFCSIPFDIVCTTNCDFLLERQYDLDRIYNSRTVINEAQLPIGMPSQGVTLLKLHGDLAHPERLVLTEEDYDGFLERYPLLATYLANLLISRTAILVGYSAEDPDFRRIWQVIGERLGRLRRQAYALMVDPRPTDVARFARRGVKVLALPGSKADYGNILSILFGVVGTYWKTNLPAASHVTEEEPLKELSLPADTATSLCLFAVPVSVLSFYRERVFPIAQRFGLVPVVPEDLIGVGDNVIAKTAALLERASAAIVDVGEPTPNAFVESGLVMSKLEPERVLVVATVESHVDVGMQVTVNRPADPFTGPPGTLDGFFTSLEDWFAKVAHLIRPQLADEPQRLLDAREYGPAVISAIKLLEVALRNQLSAPAKLPTGLVPIGVLLQAAETHQIIDEEARRRIRDWLSVRNVAVHTNEPISARQAREIVSGVQQLIERLGR